LAGASTHAFVSGGKHRRAANDSLEHLRLTRSVMTQIRWGG